MTSNTFSIDNCMILSAISWEQNMHDGEFFKDLNDQKGDLQLDVLYCTR